MRGTLAVMSVAAGWDGRGGDSAGPKMRAAPGTGGGEVDVDGRGARTGEESGEAVAELRQRGGEPQQARGDGGAGQVQGVAVDVEAAFEHRRFLAAEAERGG